MDELPENVEYHTPEDVCQALNCTVSEFRAGVIAYCFRLGKVPPVGFFIGFSIHLRHLRRTEIDSDDKLTADSGEAVTEKVWVGMNVTQDDITNAKTLINDQRLTYKEPKFSMMTLTVNTPEKT